MPRPRAAKPRFALRRRGDRYYVAWYQDGRPHRISAGTTDEREARRFLVAHEAGWNFPAPPPQPTIGAILDGYLADRLGRVAAHATLRYAAAALRAELADLTPQHLTVERVRHYAATRRAAGRRDGTVIREIVTLRAALRWAQKANWIDAVPHVEAPPAPLARDRWLTKQEADRLAAAAAPHVRLFVALARHTAARAGALLGLRWSQVDLRAGRINLRDTEVAGTDPATPRGNKRRSVVPINGSLRAALEEALEIRTTDYVIEFRGGPVLSIKRGFQAAARRANLTGVTPHVIRHSAATWMAQQGVPLGEIARYLGNSIAMVENVYAHHHPDFMRGASAALE